jgi:hypothetical protein
MRAVSDVQRRRAVVRRHYLAGDAGGPDAVTAALVALHATDPASVYLSVLARSASSTLADVSDAMYRRRSLVRWMAMRRTLFVLPRDDVPTVHAAVSAPLADVLRRRLISRIERSGTEPVVAGDVGAWLADLAAPVTDALHARGTATGSQLGADVPALRTAIVPRTASDRPQNITSPLLTLLGTEGRMVRSTPTGPWTSRHHRWEPVEHLWPDGLPRRGTQDAQRSLAHRWLTRFGPATVGDLQWWTGWNKTTVRRALSDLALDEVDLHGEAGFDLTHVDDDPHDHGPTAPMATLLPALDPTPMGWRRRHWFLGIEPTLVFDRAGNVGPTLWWDGEIIGSWAVASTGEVRIVIVADRGAEAATAAHDAASRLQQRLQGTVVTSAIRTPLEQSLTRVSAPGAQ